MSSTSIRPDVVVLGSGVLGLSIAIELVSKGYKPLVVGKDLAQDIYSTGFASPWAGCNWYSFAEDKEGQEYDKISYERYRTFAKEQPELCEMIPFSDVWNEGHVEDLYFKDFVPDYQRLTNVSDFSGGHKQAIIFKSFILHAPNYIAFLTQQLKDQGVKFIKHRVSSLDQAYALPLPDHLSKAWGTTKLEVDLVINATGLGAKTLLGVQDDKVYPIRGQTVLVKSAYANRDGKKRCYMGYRNLNVEAKPGDKVKEAAYIIPRPGSCDEIVLGGTFLAHEWNTLPDPSTSQRILEDCFRLNPDLAGLPKEGIEKSWKDIEVIGHNVGLRPGREGGVRVELEERQIETASSDQPLIPGPKGDLRQGRKGAVVHAYGIGPAGYQSSWGIAEKVASLVDGWARK